MTDAEQAITRSGDWPVYADWLGEQGRVLEVTAHGDGGRRKFIRPDYPGITFTLPPVAADLAPPHVGAFDGQRANGYEWDAAMGAWVRAWA